MGVFGNFATLGKAIHSNQYDKTAISSLVEVKYICKCHFLSATLLQNEKFLLRLKMWQAKILLPNLSK